MNTAPKHTPWTGNGMGDSVWTLRSPDGRTHVDFAKRVARPDLDQPETFEVVAATADGSHFKGYNGYRTWGGIEKARELWKEFRALGYSVVPFGSK